MVIITLFIELVIWVPKILKLKFPEFLRYSNILYLKLIKLKLTEINEREHERLTPCL